MDKIDINSASDEELQTIEGIDGERSRLIIDARQRRGGFDSWDQVEAVEGIGDILIDKIKEAGTLGRGSTRERGVTSKTSTGSSSSVAVSAAPRSARRRPRWSRSPRQPRSSARRRASWR